MKEEDENQNEEKAKEEVTNDNANKFEEVEIYQEVETVKKEVRTDSYFDGKLLDLIGWRILAILISGITLGIGIPWAKCMLYNYQLKHTVYNGKRLKFEGTGGDLFVNMFKWIFFTIITLGIYAFFIPVRKTRWVISNIHYEDENFTEGESFFDGKTIQLICVNILCKLLTIISFGLLYPFTVCYKLKWINKHTIINRKKLVFTGKATSLFGKYILWWFLTIITFGIFGLWVPIKMLKWQTKNVHIKTVGEEEQKDKPWLIVIPIIVAVLVIAIIIAGLSALDWNYLSYRIQYLTSSSYDKHELQRQMLEEIMEKKENGEITEDEINKLIEKYDLDKDISMMNGLTFIKTEAEEKSIIPEQRSNSTPSSSSSSKQSSSSAPSTSGTKNSSSSTTSSGTTTSVPQAKTSITVGGYTLKFGKYTGAITQFDWETQKEIKTTITLVLSENNITINGESGSYSIKGTKIIWKGQDYILEASGNNKIRYNVETCPDLIYQGN